MVQLLPLPTGHRIVDPRQLLPVQLTVSDVAKLPSMYLNLQAVELQSI